MSDGKVVRLIDMGVGHVGNANRDEQRIHGWHEGYLEGGAVCVCVKKTWTGINCVMQRCTMRVGLVTHVSCL